MKLLLPTARAALATDGDFFPAAAEVAMDGRLTEVEFEVDVEQPDIEITIEALADILRTNAGDGLIRACAICSLAMLATESIEPTDAVRVRLEHRAAEPIEVYLPYRVVDGEYAFGELVAFEGERAIWAVRFED